MPLLAGGGAQMLVHQLCYLCFRSPHSMSTCEAFAAIPASLPFSNRTVFALTDAPPLLVIDKMHYLRSLLFSALAFLLLGVDGQAAASLGTRAPTSAAESSIYKTRFPNVTWDDAAWVVNTTSLDQGHYQSRLSIANGYLGINVAAAGPFFEQDVQVDGDNVNGWPLFSQRQTFATVAGFFDEQPTTNGTNFEWLNQYGGESVISGVPHWAGIIVDLGDAVYLDATVVCFALLYILSFLWIRCKSNIAAEPWSRTIIKNLEKLRPSFYYHTFIKGQSLTILRFIGQQHNFGVQLVFEREAGYLEMGIHMVSQRRCLFRDHIYHVCS